ncbi:MAG: hypothetical protein E2O90_02745 [Alphaproteobacteria bacterium]|nr:MAG: hypothetical protein E2O90_02745 [Alphaproteobacteria bacterium]
MVEMGKIPEVLNRHILDAYPDNVCLVATSQPDGYCQVSPRGSVHVYDQDTLGYWDRGSGTTHDAVQTGAKVTIFFRNGAIGGGGKGLLPAGGVARFYGIAEVHAEDDDVREKVWNGMIAHERERDPEKKGRAVLVRIEKAEQLDHKPLWEIG